MSSFGLALVHMYSLRVKILASYPPKKRLNWTELRELQNGHIVGDGDLSLHEPITFNLA